MPKFDLHLYADKRLIETRTIGGEPGVKGMHKAIDWAAKVGLDVWREGVTDLHLIERKHDREGKLCRTKVWSWAAFTEVVGDVCTCSSSSRQSGIHSGDCPALNLPAHKIWERRKP